jgi:hypothetical protein
MKKGFALKYRGSQKKNLLNPAPSGTRSAGFNSGKWKNKSLQQTSSFSYDTQASNPGLPFFSGDTQCRSPS